MGGFTGIPQDAGLFFEQLRADNTKAFWEANKARYAVSVREPVTHLLDLLADEFGEATLFRPNRDVRFSKDKSPYKTHQGAFAATAAGMGWYLHIDADGLTTGGGFHAHAPDQVARLRAAAAADRTGRRLQTIVESLLDDGFDLGGEQLKTKPRGVPDDHPRLELLRHKSLTAGRIHGWPTWLATTGAVDHVRADWQAIRPLVEWLGTNVGPSTAEPPRRGR